MVALFKTNVCLMNLLGHVGMSFENVGYLAKNTNRHVTDETTFSIIVTSNKIRSFDFS